MNYADANSTRILFFKFKLEMGIYPIDENRAHCPLYVDESFSSVD